MPEVISPIERIVEYMAFFSFLIDAFGVAVFIWMIGQRGEEPRYNR